MFEWLTLLHQHINLGLKAFELAFCQLDELVVLEQLLGHIYAEHLRQVTHVVLFDLSDGFLFLSLHLIPLGDHLVVHLLLTRHQLHFQSLLSFLALD